MTEEQIKEQAMLTVSGLEAIGRAGGWDPREVASVAVVAALELSGRALGRPGAAAVLAIIADAAAAEAAKAGADLDRRPAEAG